MLHMIQLWNQKMFRDRTEATLFWPGTELVPVLVQYLILIRISV